MNRYRVPVSGLVISIEIDYQSRVMSFEDLVSSFESQSPESKVSGIVYNVSVSITDYRLSSLSAFSALSTFSAFSSFEIEIEIENQIN